MKSLKYRIIVQVLMAACLVAFAAGAWARADIIKLATGYKIITLDPVASAGAPAMQVVSLLYSPLVRYDDNDKLQPGLAKSWEMTDDGTKLVLHLRDAEFSDGSPVTADDVVFSLERAKGDDSAYPAVVSPFKAFKAKDDHTVVITLAYPGSPFVANLTAFNVGIVSKDAVESAGDDAFQGQPVSSGPYVVKKWLPNDRLILAANPHYWREGYPKNDGAELIQVTNANTRKAMLIAGEVDAIRQVPWAQIDNLRARPDINVPLHPSTKTFLSLLNSGRAPFDDVRVRQAASLALNVKAIAKAATFGHAKAANSTLSPELNFYDPDIGGMPYDPAKARKLIQEVGGVDQTINLIIYANPRMKKIATMMQAQWAQVGLKSKIEELDQAARWERVVSGDYDATPIWYDNETLDPDLAVRWAVCGDCGNKAFYTNYDNAEVNKLVREAAAEGDTDKRRAMYDKIQKITTNQVTFIPLYYPPYTHAYSTDIEGLKMIPVGEWTLAEAHHVD